MSKLLELLTHLLDSFDIQSSLIFFLFDCILQQFYGLIFLFWVFPNLLLIYTPLLVFFSLFFANFNQLLIIFIHLLFKNVDFLSILYDFLPLFLKLIFDCMIGSIDFCVILIDWMNLIVKMGYLLCHIFCDHGMNVLSFIVQFLFELCNP